MSMVRWLVLLLVVTSGAAIAAEPALKSRDFWVRGSISIDADGRIGDLVWDPQAKAHSLIAERITPIVKAWEFIPAIVDGKPLATKTGLTVHLRADEDANGSFGLRIVGASTGAMVWNMSPPLFPAASAGADVSARVVVEVSVAADGQPIVHDMRYSANNGGSMHRKRFLDATKAAMKTWKFRPELVAGQSAPSRMTIPVMFCMDLAWCQAREREDALAKSPQLPPGLNMASESAVALKTRIDESGDI